MQSRSPIFEEIAKAMENAVGLAQAAGEEARAVFRAQADRVTAELDLVRREDMDALRLRLEAEISELRDEVARLKGSPPGARAADEAG